MSHLQIIVWDCLLRRFKERTREICLDESKYFGGKCEDTYWNNKLFLQLCLMCIYFANNFCYCKRVNADQICSSCHDKERTFDREKTKFCFCEMILWLKIFRLDVRYSAHWIILSNKSVDLILYLVIIFTGLGVCLMFFNFLFSPPVKKYQPKKMDKPKKYRYQPKVCFIWLGVMFSHGVKYYFFVWNQRILLLLLWQNTKLRFFIWVQE